MTTQNTILNAFTDIYSHCLSVAYSCHYRPTNKVSMIMAQYVNMTNLYRDYITYTLDKQDKLNKVHATYLKYHRQIIKLLENSLYEKRYLS